MSKIKYSGARLLLFFAAILAFRGSAMAESHLYEVRVGEFSNLQVLDNVRVVWTANPDSAGYARYVAPERFADAFIFANNGKGTLKVQVSTEDVNDPDLPVLYLYSSFLTAVRLSGALPVSVTNPPACAEFKVELIGNGALTVRNVQCTRLKAKLNTGNGVIRLQGKADDASYKMLGTGQIQADELQAMDVHCSVLGTGSIFCYATDYLKVKGIGSTKIYYKGNPREVKKVGGGHLIPFEGMEE